MTKQYTNKVMDRLVKKHKPASAKELASLAGCSYPVALSHWNRLDLPKGRPGRPPIYSLAQMQQHYDSLSPPPASQVEFARTISCSIPTVRKYWPALNLNPNPNSRSTNSLYDPTTKDNTVIALNDWIYNPDIPLSQIAEATDTNRMGFTRFLNDRRRRLKKLGFPPIDQKDKVALRVACLLQLLREGLERKSPATLQRIRSRKIKTPEGLLKFVEVAYRRRPKEERERALDVGMTYILKVSEISKAFFEALPRRQRTNAKA